MSRCPRGENKRSLEFCCEACWSAFLSPPPVPPRSRTTKEAERRLTAVCPATGGCVLLAWQISDQSVYVAACHWAAER
ncbi:hypothetical protein EYF80_054913 [Liparis tanakae]|uniref:Uncharacterized protein n=1 Tax=Liparis tanakae TaxID=230148 RepID=A0A4Z2F207_9TELE|nr:hypothetical protein EYF80_054913 [Liparis tanakae]